MEAKKSKQLLIIVFLVFSLLLSVSIILIEEIFFSQSAQKVALNNAKKKSIERENIVDSFLDDSRQTLLALRKSTFFEDYLTKKINKEVLESIFLTISKSQSHFMQLRYIDKSGNEIIRIDRDKPYGKAYLVSKEKLQNKSKRYYFADSISKELEEVWFSRIDLNIENGKIQTPHTPTLRVVLPIEKDNKFNGILIINYFAKNLIKQLTNAPLYDMIVYDDNGYTIAHYNQNKNWGNSLEEGFHIQDDVGEYLDEVKSNVLFSSETFVTKQFNSPIAGGINMLLKLNENYVKQQQTIAQNQYLITASTVFILSLLFTFITIKLFAKKLLNIEQLNQLLHKNEEQTNELTQINQNLESIVKEKTKELSQKNATLSQSIIYSHTDINGIITDVSDLFCKLSGYSRNELIGNTHRILKDPDMPDSLFAQMWTTITAGKTWTGEIKNRKKDSTYVWLLSEIKPKFNTKNEIVGYVSIRSDITAKKELEEQHKLLSEQTKLASMGEMIGNIAHQWRQPLSSISISATGTLYKKELGVLKDEDFAHEMNNINEKAQYLSKTIDTFRNFIKGDKKQIVVSISEQIEETLGLINSTLKNYFIEVETNIPEDELQIEITEGEFIQVLINVINNAKDALIQKEIEEGVISISLKKYDDLAILTIEDNAGGIPENILPQIFEPYFTTKHQSQGTGLGLHMSYKIITESCGGRIYASNTKTGAKFTLELPLYEG